MVVGRHEDMTRQWIPVLRHAILHVICILPTSEAETCESYRHFGFECAAQKNIAGLSGCVCVVGSALKHISLSMMHFFYVD